MGRRGLHGCLPKSISNAPRPNRPISLTSPPPLCQLEHPARLRAAWLSKTRRIRYAYLFLGIRTILTDLLAPGCGASERLSFVHS